MDIDIRDRFINVNVSGIVRLSYDLYHSGLKSQSPHNQVPSPSPWRKKIDGSRIKGATDLPGRTNNEDPIRLWSSKTANLYRKSAKCCFLDHFVPGESLLKTSKKKLPFSGSSSPSRIFPNIKKKRSCSPDTSASLWPFLGPGEWKRDPKWPKSPGPCHLGPWPCAWPRNDESPHPDIKTSTKTARTKARKE